MLFVVGIIDIEHTDIFYNNDSKFYNYKIFDNIIVESNNDLQIDNILELGHNTIKEIEVIDFSDLLLFDEIKTTNITIDNDLIDILIYNKNTDKINDQNSNQINSEIINDFSNIFNNVTNSNNNQINNEIINDFSNIFDNITHSNNQINSEIINNVTYSNNNQIIFTEIQEYNDYIDNIIQKYFNGIDIIYWINLERSIKRKKNMELILLLLPVNNIRINAIDGLNDTDKNIYGCFVNTNTKIKKTEYACLLSHLNTIRIFNQNKKTNIALIFEDDISLDYIRYWNKSITQIINEAPKNWEIIMLAYIYNSKLDNLYTLNKGNIYSTAAYLINKKGSNKLINQIYKNNKYILPQNCNHTADNFIFSNLITYTYKFPYFTYIDNNTSTIHPEHLKMHSNSKINITNQLKNINTTQLEHIKVHNNNNNKIDITNRLKNIRKMS